MAARTHAPPRPELAGAPHADVAERFRYFLESQSLSREDFVAAVDGAITARSLFAILAGARRPSRSLAVLIERTFGFRAAFLLDGRGAMWVEPTRARTAALTDAERRMIAFVRRSVDNAERMEEWLDQAELWERLYARTERLLAELEAAGRSSAAEDLAIYPAFARLLLAESRLIAERHEQLVALAYRRRVRALTRRFVHVFVERLPRRHLRARERSGLDALLGPAMARHADDERRLSATLASLRATLENVARLASPLPMLRAHSSHPRTERLRAARDHLREALLAGRRPPRDAVRRALADLDAEIPEGVPFADRMRRLAESVLAELGDDLPSVRTQSLADLEALHRAIAEPLID